MFSRSASLASNAQRQAAHCRNVVLLFAKNQARNYARQQRGSFISTYEPQDMNNPHTTFPVATVFGCSGFIGNYITAELTHAGYQVITPYRGSEFKVQEHRVLGDVGQVIPMRYAADKYETILDICARSNIVICAVGRRYQKKFDDDWKFANVTLPHLIARASRETAVDRFVYVSHLGADLKHPSPLLRQKAQAEDAVRQEFPEATVLRPAPAYGPQDYFINHIAKRLKATSYFGVPIVRNGHARLQPVFVANIADAVIASLTSPKNVGKTFELGGPDVIKYNEIINAVARYINQPYNVTAVNDYVAPILGKVLEFTHNRPVFTLDHAIRLQYDNLVSEGALTFADLGLEPVPFNEGVFPMLRKFLKPSQLYLVPDNYSYKPSV